MWILFAMSLNSKMKNDIAKISKMKKKCIGAVLLNLQGDFLSESSGSSSSFPSSDKSKAFTQIQTGSSAKKISHSHLPFKTMN